MATLTRQSPREESSTDSDGVLTECPLVASACEATRGWERTAIKLLKNSDKKNLKSSHIIYKETKIIMRVDLLEIMQSRIRTATSLKSGKKKTYNFILHKNL